MSSRVVLTIEGNAMEVREQALNLFLPSVPREPEPDETGKHSESSVTTGKSSDRSTKVGKEGKSDPKKEPVKETPKSEPEKPVDQNTITQSTIADTVPKLVSKAGRAKTIELLGEFGAKNAKEVKPEQYAAFMVKANELLR